MVNKKSIFRLVIRRINFLIDHSTFYRCLFITATIIITSFFVEFVSEYFGWERDSTSIFMFIGRAINQSLTSIAVFLGLFGSAHRKY